MSTGKYVRYQFNQFGGKLEATEVDIPTPQGDEVLVKVDFCGVCHSDVHIHEGFYRLGGGKKLSFEDRGINPPVVLGHEIVGTVEAVGENANAPVGKQVLVYPWAGCGECEICQAGDENLCPTQKALGVYTPGGYSQYVLVSHSRYLFDIEGLNPAHASLLACSGLTTYSAVKQIGHVHASDAVVVIGAGGLGQLAIRILSLKGVKNIIALDLSASKREAALQVGAHHAFDPTDEEVIKQMHQVANHRVYAALDFVGASETTQLGVDVVRKGGKVVVIGLHGGEVRYPLPFLTTRAVSVIGSYVGSLNDEKELLEFAKEHDLFNLAIETQPLSSADESLRKLIDGQVAGRLVLDATES